MSDVPYSWLVYARLRWQDGSIAKKDQISQILVWESYKADDRALCGAGLRAADDGICEMYFGREKFYPPRETPTLYIEVYSAQYELLHSQTFGVVTNNCTLDIVISGAACDDWLVHGRVTADEGGVGAGIVEIFDHYDNEVVLIKSGQLDSSGQYSFVITQNDFAYSTDHPSPNIHVRASTDYGTVQSDVIYNIPKDQTVDLHISEGMGDWSVSGSVYKKCEGLATSGRVEAFDVFDGADTSLGQDYLNAQGMYHIVYSADAFGKSDTHPAPTLVLKVYDGATLLGASLPVPNASKNEFVDIFIEGDSALCDRCVQGTVRNKVGLPVTGLIVQVKHLSLVNGTFVTQSLSEASLDENGHYRIVYNSDVYESQGGDECCDQTGRANIYVTVNEIDPDGQLSELKRSEFMCVAEEECPEIDFVVDMVSNYDNSEFKQLNQAIIPCVGNPPSDELMSELKSSDEKRRYISCQIGWATDFISAYALAHVINKLIHSRMDKLGNPGFSGQFPVQIIYALIREDRGSSLDALLENRPDDVFDAIVRAIAKGTIANSFQDSLKLIMEDWRAILAGLLLYSDGQSDNDSWQKKLLDLAAPSESHVYILNKYFDHPESFDAFMNALEEEDDISKKLPEAVIVGIRFVFEAYALTGWFMPLVAVLFEYRFQGGNQWNTVRDLVILEIDSYSTGDTPPVEVKGWDFYVGESASQNEDALPKDIPGGTLEEQIKIYSTRLFNALNQQSPDNRLITQMIESDELDEDLQLAADFFNDHKDYDLEKDHIDIFAKENGIDPDSETRKYVKEVQRLYHLTADLEAVIALHNANYVSAMKISSIAEGEFVAELEGQVGGLTAATRIHRAAVHRASEIAFVLGQFHQSLNSAGSGAAIPEPPDLEGAATAMALRAP